MNELEQFGAFFVRNFRDKALDNLEFIMAHKWKAPSLQDLQNRVAKMTPEDKEVMRAVVNEIIITSMHDILFEFQTSHDNGTGIDIIVKGKSVASLSDGLHGELFSDRGWLKKYSKYKYEEKI